MLDELVVEPAPLGQLVVAKDELIADYCQWEEKGNADGYGQAKHAQLYGHPVCQAVLASGWNLKGRINRCE